MHIFRTTFLKNSSEGQLLKLDDTDEEFLGQTFNGEDDNDDIDYRPTVKVIMV